MNHFWSKAMGGNSEEYSDKHRKYKIVGGAEVGAMVGMIVGSVGGCMLNPSPEYAKTVDQVAASNVVAMEGSANLSAAQVQEKFVDEKVQEEMRRQGIKKLVNSKRDTTLFEGVTGGAVVGGATAALLTRRKKHEQLKKSGAAEIS